MYKPDNVQIVLTNPFNSRKTIIELWANPIGQYTVRAGANSDFSYTGLIRNIANMDHMKTAIIEHHNANKVFR